MDPPGSTTWIHQDPPRGSTRIHHLDPPESTIWIQQDPPFGGRKSKTDQGIAILKLFDHRERASRAIPIGAHAPKNFVVHSKRNCYQVFIITCWLFTITLLYFSCILLIVGCLLSFNDSNPFLMLLTITYWLCTLMCKPLTTNY